VIEQLAQSRGSHWKPIGDFIVLQQFVLWWYHRANATHYDICCAWMEHACHRLCAGAAWVIVHSGQSHGSPWRPVGDIILLWQFVYLMYVDRRRVMPDVCWGDLRDCTDWSNAWIALATNRLYHLLRQFVCSFVVHIHKSNTHITGCLSWWSVWLCSMAYRVNRPDSQSVI
jgi:hypothetical protein